MAKDQPTGKGKAPVASARTVTVPGPEDLQHAKDDALLQLRIGRSAHFYTVVISALLALDAVLLLYFQPNFGSLKPGSWTTSAYLLLPILAGVTIAGVGLAAKWEEYMLWPWEAHFSVTVGAFAVNVLLLVVFVLHVGGYSAFAGLAIWPWIYPASLFGITLGLIGLVLTWSGWTNRQWAAAISATLPLATALVLLFPPKSGGTVDDLLATSLFISAILYQSSGSFLHLISSGTRPHERELITTGQTRMFRLAEELRAKEEALHFRELALVKREAAAENDELSIKRQNESLAEARTQLDELEQDYRQRADAVVAKEREWAGKSAEIDAQTRQNEDRSKALDLREQEVARSVPQISARESRLVQREGELTQREVELNQRQQDLARQQGGLPETETRLEARRKELDQRTNDLLRREGEIAAREAAVGAGGAAGAKTGTSAAAQDLGAREVKLQQFKAVLDEQNLVLGRKAKENAERARSVETALKASATKEALLATREATLRQKEAEVADQLKAAQDRRDRYELAARDYETRASEIEKTRVSTAQQKVDFDRSTKTLAEREASLADRESRVKSAIAEIQARESQVNARERSLSAQEAEVGLRRQEIAQGTGLPLTGAAAAGVGPGTVPAAPGARRPMTIREVAPAEAPAAETLRPAVGRRIADRLPTGTPRLDDLLLGGLPPKSHVVVVGDPFVGKEVVVYAFLAEGLKRGEPAIVVTAARPPGEVTESLGLVLPQFREYEQMGMVTWVDASGAGTTTGSGATAHRIVTKGSDDRAGILSALVKSAKMTEEGRKAPFRVGFIGLSAVLAHTDERAGFSFLQNVVGILKPRNALAMYTLESGAISDAQVETLLGRMDGAILFRQDRDRTFLCVKGLGEAQTRDWVECRATNRALIVGSFALERIR